MSRKDSAQWFWQGVNRIGPHCFDLIEGYLFITSPTHYVSPLVRTKLKQDGIQAPGLVCSKINVGQRENCSEATFHRSVSTSRSPNQPVYSSSSELLDAPLSIAAISTPVDALRLSNRAGVDPAI